MSAVLNIGIDLGGRTISASTLPSGTVFPSDTVVLRTNKGNYIREYERGDGWSCLLLMYQGGFDQPDGFYVFLYQYKTGETAEYNDITLPDDFGVVTEVDEDSVSYPYILRTDHEKVYAFTEDLNKVELTGTVLYPDVLYVGNVPSGNIFPTSYFLNESAANYSHMRIYYATKDNYYSSVDVYQPNDKTVYLMSGSSTRSNSTAYLKAIAVTIDNSIIFVNESTAMNLKLSPSVAYADTHQVFITRVEAWN